MSDRRNFLAGAGSVLLAAVPESANADPGENSYIYAGGVVWNPNLPGILGELRMEVYLAVRGDGTGIGTLNDPVHSQFNSHARVLRTIRNGNEYQFEGAIVRSNDPGLIGQSFVVLAVTNGDGTLLNFKIGNNVLPGLGRIVNVRANATKIQGSTILP